MAKEQKIIHIRKSIELPQNEVRDILLQYLPAHSSRKFNYLFWNILDQKYPKLLFSNLVGKDLVKINNGDLRFRIEVLKNKKHWEVIKWFVNKYLIAEGTDKRAINVIRLDYAFSQLKKFKFDFDTVDFLSNRYGAVLIPAEDKPGEKVKKAKIVSYIDRDIQSVYLVESLFNYYSFFEEMGRLESQSDQPSPVYHDILDDYVNADVFKVFVPDTEVSIIQVDGLDCPSTTFLKKSTNPALKAIFIQDGVATKLVTVMDAEGDYPVSIVTVRVYLSYFLGKRTRKHKRLAKGVEVS